MDCRRPAGMRLCVQVGARGSAAHAARSAALLPSSREPAGEAPAVHNYFFNFQTAARFTSASSNARVTGMSYAAICSSLSRGR
jgi:hypothetical protein